MDSLGIKEAGMSTHLCQRAHTLCFECYRSERNRARAHTLADAAVPLGSPFTNHDGISRTLTEREVAHRQRMLSHMAGQTNIAS